MLKILKENEENLNLFNEISKIAQEIVNGNKEQSEKLISLMKEGINELTKNVTIAERIISKTNGFREFEKEDWYGYAGCERFEDGSEPVIKSFEFGEIIVDEDGDNFIVGVYFYPDEETGKEPSEEFLYCETDSVDGIIEFANKADKITNSSEDVEKIINNLRDAGFRNYY